MYWTSLFTPTTWGRFLKSGGHIMGYASRHEGRVKRLAVDDILVCYIVRACKWSGILRVKSAPFFDNKPIFEDGVDQFSLRIQVEPITLLEEASAVGVDELWNLLNRTKNADKSRKGWAYRARLINGPLPIDEQDGRVLYDALRRKDEVTRAKHSAFR